MFQKCKGRVDGIEEEKDDNHEESFETRFSFSNYLRPFNKSQYVCDISSSNQSARARQCHDQVTVIKVPPCGKAFLSSFRKMLPLLFTQ